MSIGIIFVVVVVAIAAIALAPAVAPTEPERRADRAFAEKVRRAGPRRRTARRLRRIPPQSAGRDRGRSPS
ncbi:hypothetical protein [Streptomyces sp. NPDC048606]|uniref:hypothetical protein n=1 Tax=Streptomyces sp. NPDC048606 TaxID=3154726 RepID=UPI00343F6B11